MIANGGGLDFDARLTLREDVEPYDQVPT